MVCLLGLSRSQNPQNQMAMAAEVAVFTETNIGTRLALSVPPNITAADFKRRLETEHFGCFPGAGAMRVHKLMVNRRSCFYHLPDSMPINCIFLGSRGGAWFLHADLVPSVVECVAAKDHEDGTNSNKMVETSCATSSSSDVVSVEGLIKKYFTSFTEASNCSSHCIKFGPVQSRARGKQKLSSNGGGGKSYSCRKSQAADFTLKTPPRRLLNYAVSSPPNKSKVGKRLVMASYSLGISPGQETVSSLRRSKTGKSLRRSDSSSPIRCPVFEISGDSDD